MLNENRMSSLDLIESDILQRDNDLSMDDVEIIVYKKEEKQHKNNVLVGNPSMITINEDRENNELEEFFESLD